MLTESVASNEVMLPDMGKFIQELSVWQTEEESRDSGARGKSRRTIAIYSSPPILALARLSIFA